ncbi:MAG: DUF4013 domain-containing protein [Myxococcaceae bacterium]
MVEKLKAAFLGIFADASWPITIVKQGAFLLIPFVGYVALLGWQRRAFEAAREGDHKLPPAGFGVYLSAGWTPFFAIVLMYLIPVALFSLLIGVPAQILHIRIGAWLPMEIFQVPLSLAIICAYVEVARRAFVSGEVASILKPAPSVRAIKAAPQTYLIIAAAMIGAYIAATAGLSACLIGVLFTAPLGHAIAANLLAVWQNELAQRNVQ